MTEYVWGELRDRAIAAYHDAPGAELEQRILNVFRQHPQIVAALVDAIAARVQAGKVRSGWAVLATECERATATSDERATDTSDRTKAVKRAEQWMRSAGMHFDRWGEVDDELFGPLGNLRHWKDDRQLRQRMESLWLEVRPDGERTEQEAVERAERHRQAHPVGDPPAGRPEPVPTPHWGPPAETVDEDDDLPF